MKKIVIVMIFMLVGDLCEAEPAQVDKTAIVASISANSAERDGAWLKWACEEYKSWNKDPGSLWKGTDTKKENLGAGLCAGFISGVIHAPGIDSCIAKHAFAPELILEYLQKHPELLGSPAGQLVVDAISTDGICS